MCTLTYKPQIMNLISEEIPIRNAATVVIRRMVNGKPFILMGQRGKNASFMPNKFVFPGGAIDEQDKEAELAFELEEKAINSLTFLARNIEPRAIIAGAIREVWEETGLRILGRKKIPGLFNSELSEWKSFSSDGFLPNPIGLDFFFRAITPPGRPRRFDARFFICNSDEICGNLDDFSEASTELSNLQWIALDAVSKLELPFITEIVLAEVAAREERGKNPEGIPFFDYSDENSQISFIET